jgi:hypothetical protein
MSQKTVMLILIAVRTSDLICVSICSLHTLNFADFDITVDTKQLWEMETGNW